MRHSSSIFITAALSLALFFTITWSACKTDKCKDVSCQHSGTCNNASGNCFCTTGWGGTRCEILNDSCALITCSNGGTCANGTCSCPTGYEGIYCQTESRTKFIRSWGAHDTVVLNNNGITVYNGLISAGTSVLEVRIGNILNGFFTHTVTGTVSGNTITVASQQPDPTGNRHSISGSATLANDTLYWNYTKTDTTGAQVNYKGKWY